MNSKNNNQSTNTKNIVKNLKEYYVKVEQGKMDYKQFKNAIANNLQVKITDKFEDAINSANEDKKTFSKLVQALDILKKKEQMPVHESKVVQEQNSKRFPRYQKQKVSGPAEKKNELQEKVTEFVNGQLNIPQFEQILRKNNINSNLEDIQRQIQNSKNGQIEFKTMMSAVERNKNSTHVQELSKVIKEQKVPRNTLTNLSIDPTSEVKNSLAEKGTKKKSMGFNPSYLSNRDVFMWEKDEEREPYNYQAQTTTNKGSQAYKGFTKNFAKKQVDRFNLHSDKSVFTWEDQPSKKQPQTPSKANIKRKDPNAQYSSEVKCQKGRQTLNYNLQESGENTLKFQA